MTNEKILEMLRNNDTENLKKLLEDEIYEKSLKSGKYSPLERYKAMKRYLKHVYVYGYCSGNERLYYPYENILITINGKSDTWNCFMNGCSFVLTHEPIGKFETFNEHFKDEEYFKIQKLCPSESDYTSTEKVNLNEVLAKAKSKGYKMLKKNFVEKTFLWNYKEAWFNITLLDVAYGIINDGKDATIHYIGKNDLMLIETSIGYVAILPIAIKENPYTDKNKTVIS